MRMFYPKLRGRSMYFCLLILSFLSFQTSFSQEARLFKGIVVDSAGAPLQGASVTVKGSKGGTSTLSDGSFSVQAAPNARAVITTVGYQTQEITLQGTDVIRIQLIAISGNNLNEVVVVGYGTQRRSDITGSVGIVNTTEMKKVSSNDVSQLLQGRVAGVQVTSDGQPGAIPSVRIRGFNTFGNAQPLYVIDGVPTEAVREFNPNDIENIQVLKDASAGAIYGSRAANGVIIVTTKQGRKNSPLRVEYNGYYGIDDIRQRIPVTNRAEYQLLNNEARRNAGRALAPANDPASPSYITNTDVNWQEEGLKQGNRQNHNIAFSGGGANTSYNVSLDYFDNNGTYVGNGPDYNRYTGRVNTSAEKGIFKIGQSLLYAHSFENALTGAGTTLQGPRPPLINYLINAIPTLPLYSATNDGGFGGTLANLQDVESLNGIGFNSLIKNTTEVDRTFATIYGEVQLVKAGGHSLRYRLNLGYDQTSIRDYFFQPTFNLGYFFTQNVARLNDNSRILRNALVENTLTYEKAFGKHAVNVLVGQTYQKLTSIFRGSIGEGFTRPYLAVVDNAAVTSAYGSEQYSTLASYLGRVNYNYNDKYLLTATIRRDGSSRFAPEYRFAYFPSIAVGWNLSNENFFKVPKSVISNIKLRGSYGILGNQNIGNYLYYPLINSNVVYTFLNPMNIPLRTIGGLQTSVVSENIKWEERSTTNIGLDAQLLNGKIDFTAEYYNSKTKDVLVPIPIPLTVGSVNSSPLRNAGTLQNSGVEIAATYRKSRGNFTFDITGNFTTIKNKVLALGDNVQFQDGVGARTEVGGEVGRHFGFVYEGIFQTQDEITKHARQEGGAATAPGDIKFKDLNGDGVINAAGDRTYLGSAIPKFTYGLNIAGGYKGFDLTVFLSGSAKYLINSRSYRELMHTTGSENYRKDMLNRWTPQNTNTTIPRLTILNPNDNDRNSNRPGWLQDGTYVRIGTVSVGYTLPKILIKGISRARVYVSGQNLYTFTKYKSYNPDFTSGVFEPGFDNGSYPRPRTILAGVTVGF